MLHQNFFHNSHEFGREEIIVQYYTTQGLGKTRCIRCVRERNDLNFKTGDGRAAERSCGGAQFGYADIGDRQDIII